MAKETKEHKVEQEIEEQENTERDSDQRDSDQEQGNAFDDTLSETSSDTSGSSDMSSDTKLRCGHETKNGKPCQMPAGWGTSHPGVGYCAHHDFQSGGIQKEGYPPLLDMMDAQTRDYVVRMLESDPELTDFSKELAAYKVKYFQALGNPDDADYELLTKMIRAIAYTAGRLDEIKHGKHVYIHVNVLNLVLQAVGETARQYLPMDRRAAFSKDLQSSIQRLLPQSTSQGIAASAMSDPVRQVVDAEYRDVDSSDD